MSFCPCRAAIHSTASLQGFWYVRERFEFMHEFQSHAQFHDHLLRGLQTLILSIISQSLTLSPQTPMEMVVWISLSFRFARQPVLIFPMFILLEILCYLCLPHVSVCLVHFSSTLQQTRKVSASSKHQQILDSKFLMCRICWKSSTPNPPIIQLYISSARSLSLSLSLSFSLSFFFFFRSALAMSCVPRLFLLTT